MIYQNRAEYLSVKITNNNSYLAHMHRQAEIFYVLDGNIEITIDGHSQLLSKGMMSIAFPNVIHMTCTHVQSSAVMIIFNDDFLPDFNTEFNMHIPECPFLTDINVTQKLYQPIMGLLESRQKNTDIRISKGYLYIIVSMLLSELPLVKHDIISSEVCRSISNYLNMHFTDEISLSQLASSLGYSKYHISHIFKEKFGCSYNSYLNRLRSEHAMGLLTHSEMSVTEVCFASGFSSLRTFYRAFNEVYGISPKAAR